MAQAATNHYGQKSHWKQQVKASKMAQGATTQIGTTQPGTRNENGRWLSELLGC